MSEMMSYKNRDEASRDLADALADTLRASIAERGRASLVICGGSSPVALFEYLSHADLDWSRVTVIPSDERWVAPDDSESNERMIRELLLVDHAATAHFVSLYRDTETPHEAVDSVAAALADVPTPLDAVVLGMGGDGHTASLFPHAPDIEALVASSARCMGVDVGPPARLSLGLGYLLDARRVDVLIFGDDKRDVLEKARGEGPVAELPIRGVLRSSAPAPTVHWAE